MLRFISGAGAIIAGVFVVATASAHHSTIGIYDVDKTVEITGTVTSVSWRNPHGQITLDVKDDTGAIVEWSAETAAISVMRNRGVDTDVIVVGDVVTIAGDPSRRNLPAIFGNNILLPSGYEFDFGANNPHFPAGLSGNMVGKQVADQANVDKAVAAADGIFRVWKTLMSDPAAFPIFKGGYPLSEAGKQGLAQWNPLDNALLHCGTKGTPLIMITPIPIEFVRQGADIMLRIEEYDARRLIHMSETAVAPTEHSLYGFSKGRWEGTTLIVSTTNIAAGHFDHLGVLQSDQITVVERFIPNATYDRLDYVMSVTDPVNFTETFDLKRYFLWGPEMSVHPYECLDRY